MDEREGRIRRGGGSEEKRREWAKKSEKDTPMDAIQQQMAALEKTRQELKADKAKRYRERNARGNGTESS